MSHLNGFTKVQGFLEIWYYDSKLFYMTTNAYPKIEWIKKKKYLQTKHQQHMEKYDFHHINIIDEYKYIMKDVDIADKLRGSNSFDHWMCKIKWYQLMF